MKRLAILTTGVALFCVAAGETVTEHEKWAGHTASYWHHRYLQAHHRALMLRHQLRRLRHQQRREQATKQTTDPAELGPRAAIRQVFTGWCPAWGSSCADQALTVAWCESRLTLTDPTGQYLGLFQMGDWERATYANGRYSTYLDQAQAAWRYFTATGKDWSPWSCKPDGSVRAPG